MNYYYLLFMIRNSAYTLFWIVFQPEIQGGGNCVAILWGNLSGRISVNFPFSLPKCPHGKLKRL
jgi:hypothetical protein